MNPTRHYVTTLLAMFVVASACGGGVDVTAAPEASAVLEIAPTALKLVIGTEVQLTARVVDSKGRGVVAASAWSSADPTIASVRASDGTVTALSTGTTTIFVVAGTLRASVTVSVRAPNPPVAVAVSPSELSLLSGDVERLIGRAYDSAGRTTSAPFEWASSDPTVATVGRSDGIVTAISVGSTMVTATVGSLRASATVSVGASTRSLWFTRKTELGEVTFDVLSFSPADHSLRSLRRPARFGSIAAPAWSVDGRQLALEVVHAYHTQPRENCCDYHSDVYVVDPSAPVDAQWRALTTNGFSKSPSWSPDGKRIAYLQQANLFAEQNAIYIAAVSGGTPVLLTSTRGWYSRPSWSPDGRRLAFSMYPGGVAGVPQMFIINADGSGLTELGTGADPSWSPDGSQIAFVSFRSIARDVYTQDIAVVDADGTHRANVASPWSYAEAPVWSSDGGQITFATLGTLYTVNLNGGAPTVLTTPPVHAWDSAPSWRR